MCFFHANCCEIWCFFSILKIILSPPTYFAKAQIFCKTKVKAYLWGVWHFFWITVFPQHEPSRNLWVVSQLRKNFRVLTKIFSDLYKSQGYKNQLQKKSPKNLKSKKVLTLINFRGVRVALKPLPLGSYVHDVHGKVEHFWKCFVYKSKWICLIVIFSLKS